MPETDDSSDQVKCGYIGQCPYCQSKEPCFNGKTMLGVSCQHPDYRPGLWEAVNEYAAACGGDTSNLTISDRRMNAVVAVDRAAKQRSDWPATADRKPVLHTILAWCDRGGEEPEGQCLHEIENIVRESLGLELLRRATPLEQPRYLVFAQTLHRCDTLAEALDVKAKYGGLIYEPLAMTAIEKMAAESMPPEDNPADDVQPTKEEWEQFESIRKSQEVIEEDTRLIEELRSAKEGAESRLRHVADQRDKFKRQLDAVIQSCYFRTKAGYVHWQQGQWFGTSIHKNTEAAAYMEAIEAIRHNAGLDADCPNCDEQPEGQYPGPCPKHSNEEILRNVKENPLRSEFTAEAAYDKH